MKVSAHARTRMEERMDNFGENTRPLRIFKDALIYGKSISSFYGGFKEYLELIKDKNVGTDVKVHGNLVYVYERSKKILITVWHIPEEFQPYDNWLLINRREKEEEANRILQEHNVNKKEDEINDMVLNEIIATRPANMVRSRGRCTNPDIANYDQRLFEIGYKECRHCGEVKKLEEFSPRQASRDGRAPYCTVCVNEKDGRKSTKVKISKPAQENISKPCDAETSSNDLYSIAAINQVMGFSDKLKEVGLTDKEFIDFIQGDNKLKQEMALIFDHLSEDSRKLYLKMKGE